MRSVYEIKAAKALLAEGYQTDYKIRPRIVPRGYKVDILGLFDILAYKSGELRFISIKGRAGIPSAHKTAVREALKGLNKGISKEIWVYRRKGLQKVIIE